jgi:hypothetical protein
MGIRKRAKAGLYADLPPSPAFFRKVLKAGGFRLFGPLLRKKELRAKSLVRADAHDFLPFDRLSNP